MFWMTTLIVCGLVWGQPTTSAALTASEIRLLQQNGVSEKTIQRMIESEKRAWPLHGTTPRSDMGVTTITRPDGRKAIVYSTGRANQEARDAEERLKEERAWELLREIIVDTRTNDDGGPRID